MVIIRNIYTLSDIDLKRLETFSHLLACTGLCIAGVALTMWRVEVGLLAPAATESAETFRNKYYIDTITIDKFHINIYHVDTTITINIHHVDTITIKIHTYIPLQ